MSGKILAVGFRHRSSLLLLLTWPVVDCALQEGGVPLRTAAVGALVLACGVALRLASVRRIGRRARVLRARAGTGLITSGPFAWSRNPLYLAAGLMLAGLAIAAGAGPAGLLLLPAAVLAYTPAVAEEERVLRGLFGEAYQAYARAVPRWIGVHRVAETAPDLRVPWREVLRREKLLLPGACFALLGVVAVRGRLLPLAAIVEGIGRPVGLAAPQVAALGLCVAAALNSWGIERKRRRSARAHAELAAPGRDASASSS